MLAYKHFQVVPEFEDELNVVLKCPNPRCGHIFSPGFSTDEIKTFLVGIASV